MLFRLVSVSLVTIFLLSCTSSRISKTGAPVQISRLKLLDLYTIPHALNFNGTNVGGLSGIDYDAAKDQYFMICDDRSSINPARYYTAKIPLRDQKIDTVVFTDVVLLKDENNRPYPGSKTNPARTPDPEAMRYNPLQGNLIWSSEGERIVRAKDTVLTNPSITLISPSGNRIDSFTLPLNLNMHATEKGPRQNGVLEGMSFANNYKTLYVNVEEPLYEDGPRAELSPNKAFVRIYRFDVAAKKNTAQYAYELDPVAYPPSPAGSFKVNGIPDLLSLGNNRLLVLERSYSTGRIPCTIKVFIADLNTASDISNNPSLKTNTGFTPVQKQLLLNMDELKVFTDNIEGVTFGPRLPNGNPTLLFVADNNFSPFQQSQIFLFEIIP
ncbi:MAG: esterase-like activity of phytase family protein [Sphingobacteriia bacterium]|nr:esterase-like activity of phytase family protein [Sphingobacteriia bacterium]